ncbi:receptor-like kinase TMK3 [Oryza brachyantha]|uniref:receptor-like kinase TMK3 n=1 Tax=Oryza brachyantha TaxID=4533 RepID=UPI001ADA93F6|nr:receptor-like kinase TMK3 [Oryza brachyantha]
MSIVPVLLVFVVVMLVDGGGARRLAAVPTDASDAAAMRAIAKATRAGEAMGWGVKLPDPCDGSWAGVRCNDAGRVASINASRGGLVARLSGADLSKLAFLSDLDLSFNGLNGDLPTFAVDDNDMVFPTIPDDVLACPNLRSFSANNAGIFGPFPHYFGNTTLFPALESLSLAGNRLTGGIRDGFGKNSGIKYLDVGGQHDDADGGGRRTLDGRVDLFIPGMENLVEVRLDHNAFTGPVPNAAGLVNLRVFDASYNDLCGVPVFANAGAVAANFAGNPNIGNLNSRQ